MAIPHKKMYRKITQKGREGLIVGSWMASFDFSSQTRSRKPAKSCLRLEKSPTRLDATKGRVKPTPYKEGA